MLAPEVTEHILGEVTVKGVFKITRNAVITGGEVTKGKLSLPALARVYRGKELLADEVEVVGLQSGQQEVKEVPSGSMCGLSLKTTNRLEVKEEDRIEFFRRETKTRSL